MSKKNEKGNGVSLAKRLDRWGMKATNTLKEKSTEQSKEKKN